MPLGQALEPRDVKVEGKTRISDGRLGQALGPYEVHGANVTHRHDADGRRGQGRDADQRASSPRRAGSTCSARRPTSSRRCASRPCLDNSYRNQLGLDINDLVQGDVGVEVTVGRDARGERRVHLRADLLNAEVVLDSVAWRKPKGKRQHVRVRCRQGRRHLPDRAA